jgi:hypothetical protein
MRRALLALVALAACSRGPVPPASSADGATTARDGAPPGGDGAASAPDGRTSDAAAPITPPIEVTTTCNVSCPRLEAVGPAVELLPPHESSMGQAALTFTAGRWYVAWGGRPANVTQIQRLTAEAALDGPTVRIEGTTPRALLPGPTASAGPILLGWIPPAYTAAGRMTSLHRFAPDLGLAAPPLLARGPGSVLMRETSEVLPGGDILVTSLLERPGGLVREVRFPLAAKAGEAAALRDWRPGRGVDSMSALDRVGDQRVVVEVAGGDLQVRPLLDDGRVGAPTSILEVPAAEKRQITFSKRVGDRYWIGAWAADHTPVVRMRAVDPVTLAPVGEPIRIVWPAAPPERLIDASGTPMLLGHLGQSPVGSSLVPIDPAARAACAPNMVFSPGLRGSHAQTLRAIHFEGDTAGVVLDAWRVVLDTNIVERRLFFSRLRCAR